MVVAAAGNDGGDGLWTYGAPASETDSFAVGSTDNTYSLGAALSISRSIKVRGEFTRTVGKYISELWLAYSCSLLVPATLLVGMQHRLPESTCDAAGGLCLGIYINITHQP